MNTTTLLVRGASDATIYISIETDYWNENATSSELEEITRGIIDNTSARDALELLNAHQRDFRYFYDRTALSLGNLDSNKSSQDLTERYKEMIAGEQDLGLISLLFQFGRYLMISSSRAGSLPPNLVGIWTNEYDAAWGGKFTTNLNVEMNHWLTELVGLSEMSHQLFDFTLKRVMPNGHNTAKFMYGCPGWVSHHNNDVWGDTAPHDKYVNLDSQMECQWCQNRAS